MGWKWAVRVNLFPLVVLFWFTSIGNGYLDLIPSLSDDVIFIRCNQKRVRAFVKLPRIFRPLFWHFVLPSSFLFFHPVTFSSDVLVISSVLCSLGWNLSFLYSSEYFVLFLLGIIWNSLLFLRIPIWPLFSDISATEFSFFCNLIFSWNLYSRIPFSCFQSCLGSKYL